MAWSRESSPGSFFDPEPQCPHWMPPLSSGSSIDTHIHTQNPFLISILVLEMGCYFKSEIYSVVRKEIIIQTLSSIQIGKSTHAPCVTGAAAQSLGSFPASPHLLFTWGLGPTCSPYAGASRQPLSLHPLCFPPGPRHICDHLSHVTLFASYFFQ